MKRLLKLLLLSLLSVSILAEARLPPIKPGVPGKKRGDIIAPMLDEQVAAWCDFSKQIVVTRSNILCVYNGEKIQMPAEVSRATPLFRIQPKETTAIRKIKSRPVPKDLANLYEMPEYGDA